MNINVYPSSMWNAESDVKLQPTNQPILYVSF